MKASHKFVKLKSIEWFYYTKALDKFQYFKYQEFEI